MGAYPKGFWTESSEKVIFAGLGALQGESLQDEPRLRRNKLLWFKAQSRRAGS
jgi:hypothetical protein